MSDHLDDLRDAAQAVAASRPVTGSLPVDAFDNTMWKQLEQLGFTSLTVPEELKGAGGDLHDAAVVVRAAAMTATPLAEAAFLAGPLLTAAGLTLPSGPVTAAAAPDAALTGAEDGAPRLSATLARVPWLASVDHVVVLVRDGDRDVAAVVSTKAPGFSAASGVNLAGEHRDSAVLNDVPVAAMGTLPTGNWFRRFELLGATARTVQMAGAAAKVLEATVKYVSERVQFGRPLAAFQAIQHQISRLAADVVTVEVAADSAVRALTSGSTQDELQVAAAKAEASALARSIAAYSHQAHGAIGFTMEHSLGAYTKRLWSWREEFGNETRWYGIIADLAQEHDGAVWPMVTGTASVEKAAIRK